MTDAARDKYYRRKYGVGLDWYNARFEEQGGRCGICRRPQDSFTKRFAIDHCHKTCRLKINTRKFENAGKWDAWARLPNGDTVHATRPLKTDARKYLKATLRLMSCRGLLCPWCNRGLRYYADDPVRLANASSYLKRHQNG